LEQPLVSTRRHCLSDEAKERAAAWNIIQLLDDVKEGSKIWPYNRDHEFTVRYHVERSNDDGSEPWTRVSTHDTEKEAVEAIKAAKVTAHVLREVISRESIGLHFYGLCSDPRLNP
jgi:hypothetical protein